MSAATGVVGGVVGLAVLEMVVSNRHGEAGRVGTVFTTAAKILAYWLDPNVPLIPNRTGYGQSSTHVEANAYTQPASPSGSAPGGKARKSVPTPQPAILNA